MSQLQVMNYEIKLAAFEGPLDLLLHLIEKNKIDIYDIPMAELTKQYMDYIEEPKKFNVEVAADFLVMAAKLIYIKSRTILPANKSSTEADNNGVEDPREELVQRLLEYKKFQKVSEVLSSMFAAEEKFFKRAPLQLSQKVLPPQDLSPQKLLKALISATTRADDVSIPDVLVSAEHFSVKDKMTAILSHLESGEKLKLTDVLETKNINEIVTTFLALLELVKRRKVQAEQLMPFSEIYIKMIQQG